MLKTLITAFLSLSLLTLTACESTGPKYRNVRSFSEGLAPVQPSSGKWGFINKRGDWL